MRQLAAIAQRRSVRKALEFLLAVSAALVGSYFILQSRW
jgi:hypothetical protein